MKKGIKELLTIFETNVNNFSAFGVQIDYLPESIVQFLKNWKEAPIIFVDFDLITTSRTPIGHNFTKEVDATQKGVITFQHDRIRFRILNSIKNGSAPPTHQLSTIRNYLKKHYQHYADKYYYLFEIVSFDRSFHKFKYYMDGCFQISKISIKFYPETIECINKPYLKYNEETPIDNLVTIF